jgi:hypothetical protein
MIGSSRIMELTLGLFLQESERDRQVKVGASDFSDPCEYHLAKKLMGIPNNSFKYWLGAKIGTATHEFLEGKIETVDLAEFPEFTSARVEKAITLGELKGYGVIKSKPDVVFVEDSHLVDWKTSKRDKSKQLKDVIQGLAKNTKVAAENTYTLKKYYAQAQIYAWGINNSGTLIDGCSIVFINRDGTNENDVWVYSVQYDEASALALWNRVNNLWAELKGGTIPDSYPDTPECFKCSVGI